MKLGEALSERARLAQHVTSIRELLDGSIITQEGQDPPASADDLIAESIAAIVEIQALVARINRTNFATTVEGDGRTLTEALARRDALGAQIGVYEFVIRKLVKSDPYSFRRAASELKDVRHIDTQKVVAERDRLAKAKRELDALIQATNWTTELVA